MLTAAILIRLLRREGAPISGFLEVFEVHTDPHCGLTRRRVKHVCRNSAQAAPSSAVYLGVYSLDVALARRCH